jgi:hypothetical protein
LRVCDREEEGRSARGWVRCRFARRAGIGRGFGTRGRGVSGREGGARTD